MVITITISIVIVIRNISSSINNSTNNIIIVIHVISPIGIPNGALWNPIGSLTYAYNKSKKTRTGQQ